jgi:hypothetical protein
MFGSSMRAKKRSPPLEKELEDSGVFAVEVLL